MNSRNPFDGCWDRIARAESHGEAASFEWNDYIETNPFGSRLIQKPDGKWSITIFEVLPIPSIVGILLGEFMYNLRAALDYCAYAIAVVDSGVDPPPNQGQSQFPIYVDQGAFDNNAYRLKPFTSEHQHWMQEIQPFVVGSNAKASPLYWLNHLAKIDRHRELHVIGAYVSESAPLVKSSVAADFTFDELDPQIFVRGDTEIASFDVSPHSPGNKISANPNTWLEMEVLEFVSERESGAEWLFEPIGKRLTTIQLAVDEIVGRFEQSCVGSTRSQNQASRTTES